MKPPSGKPNGSGSKGGFKGPGSRSPKPYGTRTYRRPTEGGPTEGFDAPHSSDDAPKRPYRASAEGGSRPYARGEGAKRPYTKSDGPKRPFSQGDGPKRPFSQGDGPKRPFSQGDGPKRPYTRSDAPKRPYTRSEGHPDARRLDDQAESRSTWKKLEPPAAEPARLIEADEPAARSPKELVELSLTIPAAMLRELEDRARDIGVEVKPLVQVWLADKLSK